MMTEHQKQNLDKLIEWLGNEHHLCPSDGLNWAIELAEEIRDHPEPIEDKCMTLRRFIGQLNLIPEEHKDKPINSISCVGNRVKNVMAILLRPSGKIDWRCDNESIELDFIASAKEDEKR